MLTKAEDELYVSVLRFLSYEAALLDDRDYRGWLSLLDENMRYQVYAQERRSATDASRFYSIVDEDASALHARVEQIATAKLTHAENPPSLVRRIFSGVNVEEPASSHELHVRSNILVFRSKPETGENGLYAGLRRDVIRSNSGQWRLARRAVYLDHTLLHGCVSILM